MAYPLTGIFAALVVLLGVVAFRAISRLQRLERAGRDLLASVNQADLARFPDERRRTHSLARLAMVKALSGLRDTR